MKDTNRPPLPRFAMTLAALLALTALPDAVRADGARSERSADADDGTHGRGYARFSDGPRRVPTPRGASLRRARALGLGTRDTARTLLRRGPESRWTRAAAWRRIGAPETLAWPVEDGRFGRGFGFVRQTRPDLRHDGVDIVAPEGSVIRAVADGIVAYSDNGVRGFGNCLLIVHPNGWVSLYAHNFRNTVQPGWRVRRGERIGFVGATGIARGPHLHFELRQGGRAIDPAGLFDEIPRRGAYLAAGPDARIADEHVEHGDDDHGENAASDASTAASSDATEHTAGSSRTAPSSGTGVAPGELGSLALVRALFAGDVSESLLEATEGRVFSNLLWPVKGGVPGRHFESGHHRGLDVEAEPGSAVRAAADGLVVYAGEGLHGMGKAVVLLHRMGWVTVYGSNREVAVEVGATVRRGEWIAKVGDSGSSEGAHLHFELHRDGSLTDPMPLLVQIPEQ